MGLKLSIESWGGKPYAIVSHAGAVSFIPDPGGRSDDELRAAVNAPPHAIVSGVNLPDEPIVWTCMVCGQWRPDALISVAHRRTVTAPELPFNVRYCNDRPGCVAFATAEDPWIGPPAHPSDTRVSGDGEAPAT